MKLNVFMSLVCTYFLYVQVRGDEGGLKGKVDDMEKQLIQVETDVATLMRGNVTHEGCLFSI